MALAAALGTGRRTLLLVGAQDLLGLCGLSKRGIPVQFGELEEALQPSGGQLRLVRVGQCVPKVRLQVVLSEIGEPGFTKQFLQGTFDPPRRRWVGSAQSQQRAWHEWVVHYPLTVATTPGVLRPPRQWHAASARFALYM